MLFVKMINIKTYLAIIFSTISIVDGFDTTPMATSPLSTPLSHTESPFDKHK